MDNSIAISLKNISKTFYIRENPKLSILEHVTGFFKPSGLKKLMALNSINLDIKKGEILGIVGHNGSGKSTLLKLMTSSFPPDKGGVIKIDGKVIRLSLGMGFDPNLSGRENIYVNGSIIGLTFKRIGELFEEIVEFSGLKEFIETPVKFYSSGMVSRLSFSIAVHADADILLLDEFFGGVGDIDFRKKSEDAFNNKFLKGKTLVLVSHDLNQITTHCNRAIILDKGSLIASGTPTEIIKKYNQRFK